MANQSVENQHGSRERQGTSWRRTNSLPYQPPLPAHEAEERQPSPSSGIPSESHDSRPTRQPIVRMAHSTLGHTSLARRPYEEGRCRNRTAVGSPRQQSRSNQSLQTRQRVAPETAQSCEGTVAGRAKVDPQSLQPAHPPQQMLLWEIGALRRIIMYHLGINEGEIDHFLGAEWEGGMHVLERWL